MSDMVMDLVQAHLAVVGLIESPIISLEHRRQLEFFREQLESDIAILKADQSAESNIALAKAS